MQDFYDQTIDLSTPASQYTQFLFTLSLLDLGTLKSNGPLGTWESWW
jgi:hypothetical protein